MLLLLSAVLCGVRSACKTRANPSSVFGESLFKNQREVSAVEAFSAFGSPRSERFSKFISSGVPFFSTRLRCGHLGVPVCFSEQISYNHHLYPNSQTYQVSIHIQAIKYVVRHLRQVRFEAISSVLVPCCTKSTIFFFANLTENRELRSDFEIRRQKNSIL